MLKLTYALIVGIFGAGIVHIAILLLVPQFSERDAWSRLAMASDLYRVTPLDFPVDGEPIVRAGDPLTRAFACRFDLEEGMVQVTAPGHVPFWSVSVYDRSGQNVYSFNDRTANGGPLDFVVLSGDQMVEVRKDLPAEFEKSIFVESQLGEGIVVLRLFQPDDSWQRAVDSFVGGLACTPR